MVRSMCAAAAAAATLGLLAPAPVARAAGSARVVAFNFTYSPDPVHIHRGDALEFTNVDPQSGEVGHTVTELAPPGEERFDSPVTLAGATSTVGGVGSLPPGTYTFHCRIHGFMKGTLIVDAGGR